jgi:hypothetical protein
MLNLQRTRARSGWFGFVFKSSIPGSSEHVGSNNSNERRRFIGLCAFYVGSMGMSYATTTRHHRRKMSGAFVGFPPRHRREPMTTRRLIDNIMEKVPLHS